MRPILRENRTIWRPIHHISSLLPLSPGQIPPPRSVRDTFSPLNLPTLRSPIQPAAGVLARPRPAGVLGQLCRRPAAHARLAVKHELGLLVGPGKPEPVLELVLADVEAVGRGGDGDVDGARDLARVLELVWFAGV